MCNGVNVHYTFDIDQNFVWIEYTSTTDGNN